MNVYTIEQTTHTTMITVKPTVDSEQNWMLVFDNDESTIYQMIGEDWVTHSQPHPDDAMAELLAVVGLLNG